MRTTRTKQELALLVPALMAAERRQSRRANVKRLTHRLPTPADCSQDQMTSCVLQCERQLGSHQPKATHSFLRARPEAKQKGASGCDGSKKHTSEKREYIVKTPLFSRHRVFAVGQGPGKGGEGSFQMSNVVITVQIPTVQGTLRR